MMAYWETAVDYALMDERCVGVPFSQQQLRSRPTVSGYYWVDMYNDGSWEIVKVLSEQEENGIYEVEVQRIGSDQVYCLDRHATMYNVSDRLIIRGKWVGPIKPTRFGW